MSRAPVREALRVLEGEAVRRALPHLAAGDLYALRGANEQIARAAWAGDLTAMRPRGG
ncbi:hypothetical protein ACIBI9_53760 [Nonomuraea sp. NPDC050451]|uniref:hypothetical protein n=1 Tax=Nonomuraea sp. NPDC050451 TaxID=3364364 RepID=UPI00379D5BFE